MATLCLLRVLVSTKVLFRAKLVHFAVVIQFIQICTILPNEPGYRSNPIELRSTMPVAKHPTATRQVSTLKFT